MKETTKAKGISIFSMPQTGVSNQILGFLMDEIKPKNIFDASGKAKKPEASPRAIPSSAPKKPESVMEPVILHSDQLLNLHHDPEINVMLNKMTRMQEDINTKLGEIYDGSGVSINQIKNFLNNPSNFPPEVWQRIQSQRDVLEKKIGDVLQHMIKKAKVGPMGVKGEVSKERKSKTLGSRRNWIPM